MRRRLTLSDAARRIRRRAGSVNSTCDAFIDACHSNARSEGIKRVAKRGARAAHGFRDFADQRLRTRCGATR